MLDKILLQVLTKKDLYAKLRKSIPERSLDIYTVTMIKLYDKYYSTYNDETINLHKFINLIKHALHASNPEDISAYETLAVASIQEVPKDVEHVVVQQLLEVGFKDDIANLVQKYMQGDDIDVIREVSNTCDSYKLQLDKKLKIPWITKSIYEILDDDEKHPGLKWRLNVLNKSMRPLRPGDFGIIAGRPDVGKTSFLASELTYFAPQITKLYDDTRYILWMNNEGVGDRIVTRLHQGALNCTIRELIAMKKSKTLISKYNKVVGASDRIRVFNIHEMWSHDIEDILDKIPPALVVFDMIDNIRFSGNLTGSRTDQVLEEQYKWARGLGVKYLCPVLATSQISNEGDGVAYPPMGALKESKTGKQGTCDFQLMIGKLNDIQMDNSRFIGLPKNKLHTGEGPKDPRSEVIFDGARCRYLTPEAL